MYVYIFFTNIDLQRLKKKEKGGELVGTYFEDYSVDMTVFYFFFFEFLWLCHVF